MIYQLWVYGQGGDLIKRAAKTVPTSFQDYILYSNTIDSLHYCSTNFVDLPELLLSHLNIVVDKVIIFQIQN